MMAVRLAIFKACLLLSVMAILTGCTTITNQIDRPLDLANQPVEDEKSHYYSVLERLGPPSKITALPEGFAFQYEYIELEERQLGLSTDLPILRWFKLALGGAEAEREVQTLVFDYQGYLRSSTNDKYREKVGKGAAFQFIVSVAQLVDTSHLEEPPLQQKWGYALLQPLPVALNREQSLDSGTRGLEQKGTPTSVGQRALEMH